MTPDKLITLFGAGQPNTWNPLDTSAHITLSNGNLTATSDGNANKNLVRALIGKTVGKWYFELTYIQPNPGSGIDDGFGVFLGTEPLDGGASTSGNGIVVQPFNGFVNSKGSFTGTQLNSGSEFAAGSLICFAVDVTNSLFWVRYLAAGQWNASGAANPATGTGGISFSLAGALYPGVCFNSTIHKGSTANFGASGFGGAVPAGFAPWSK